MNEIQNILAPHPLVLSLWKDVYRRDTHFDKLSANGLSHRYPNLCSALDAELWQQQASRRARLRIGCEAPLEPIQ